MTLAHQQTRFQSVAAVARTLQPTSPVYCLYPGVLRRAAETFIAGFPGRVLYAVKCNPHPWVLDALAAGGIDAFDTASLAEIGQVRERCPNAACYFMNPVKPRAAISTARHVHGVTVFVIDHVDELTKIADQLGRDPDVTVVVRMTTRDDGAAAFHLASKFGAPSGEAADLMRRADALGYRTGLAFHVGSQCRAPDAYRTALLDAGAVIAQAGVAPACLDVGGGFPVTYQAPAVPPPEAYMAAIRDGLAALNLPPDCEVLAEPGRALVAAGCTLLIQIHLRKDGRLYVNDGVYGSLSEMKAIPTRMPATLIRRDGRPAGEHRSFELAGPTCDSLDILPDAVTLPDDAREGDWIAIDMLGAYANALVTGFNGFRPETFVEIDDDPTPAA